MTLALDELWTGVGCTVALWPAAMRRPVPRYVDTRALLTMPLSPRRSPPTRRLR